MSEFCLPTLGQLKKVEKNGAQPHFLFPEKVPTNLCPSGMHLKSVNRSLTFMAHVLFKLLTVLGLRVSEIVHGPFKSRVLVTYSPQALLELNTTDIQNP